MRIFRRGIVYGFKGRHPRSGRTCWVYVGKTRQQLARRVAQHAKTQPWFDTVIPAPGTVAHVLYRGEVSTFGLWWREVLFIRLYRPLYNWQYNRGNARAIPPSLAEAQRRARLAGGRVPAGRLRLRIGLSPELVGVAMVVSGLVTLWIR